MWIGFQKPPCLLPAAQSLVDYTDINGVFRWSSLDDKAGDIRLYSANSSQEHHALGIWYGG